MKTFLYSIPNKIQAFSKKLDVKAALCGKSWEVFNDEGVKQLFIFNEDETILITNNGKVFNASWKYIPQNSSILIKTDDDTIMFRPAFFNNDVFALQQDGVERYLLLINEEKKSSFLNLTLDTLAAYIEKEMALSSLDKEEKRKLLLIEKQQEIEKQRQMKKQREEEERERRRQMEKHREEEAKQKEQEIQKQLAVEFQRKKEQERFLLLGYISGHRDFIKRRITIWKWAGRIGLSLFALLSLAACIILFIPGWRLPDEHSIRFGIIACLLVGVIVCLVMLSVSPMDIVNYHLENGVHFHSEEEVRKMYEEL